MTASTSDYVKAINMVSSAITSEDDLPKVAEELAKAVFSYDTSIQEGVLAAIFEILLRAMRP